jgi:tetratricopeptide (TPR) repeat protein
MSIIHEALKKAGRDEASAPGFEGPQNVRFSSHSSFPPQINLIWIGILFCLIGIIYLVYVERGALNDLFASKGFLKTSQSESSAGFPVPPTAAKTQEDTPGNLSETKSVSSEVSAEAHEKLGAGYLENGKLSDAEREFLSAEAIDPRSPDIQNNLGLVLKMQGRDAEAETRFRTALQIDPTNVQAMNNLGLLYQQQNRLEEAKRLYQKAIQTEPNFPDSHLNYAVLLERAGYFEESRQQYQSFLAAATPRQEQAAQLVKKHLNHLP